jgi:predicted GTPase
MGQQVVVVRHPMPYGDLTRQVAQRFSTYEDFDTQHCTIEEREEYEPLVDRGIVVYAGIDYQVILQQAEQEADVIIWDGGNNDTPFYFPDIHVVVFDPHRSGHERMYYPGETNLLMAHVAVINKVDSASEAQVAQVEKNIHTFNPQADIVRAESAVIADSPEKIKGQRVLVVEDGPTLTHGEMHFGAGWVAARRLGAARIVSPRPYAVGTIAETFSRYPQVANVLPAMGYSRRQIKDLETTIDQCDCDLVLFATPIDLPKLVKINKPTVRIRYEYQDHGDPTLDNVLRRRLDQRLSTEK